MEKYKSLYKWMIIPMIVMQWGIFSFYWGDFADNPWSVHIHYWTATLWYIYLIIQPYLATHNKLKLHRTNGMVGMFLAGGVCFTAMSLFYRDINLAHLALEDPDKHLAPWFSYGVVVVEFVMIVAFMYAVVRSIIHRKELENHAWWLISTVFLLMMPAVFRGVLVVWAMMVGFTSVNVPGVIYQTSFIIIGLGLVAAWKYGKLRHPATYLIVGVNLFSCFIELIGSSKTIQVLLEAIVRE